MGFKEKHISSIIATTRLKNPQRMRTAFRSYGVAYDLNKDMTKASDDLKAALRDEPAGAVMRLRCGCEDLQEKTERRWNLSYSLGMKSFYACLGCLTTTIVAAVLAHRLNNSIIAYVFHDQMFFLSFLSNHLDAAFKIRNSLDIGSTAAFVGGVVSGVTAACALFAWNVASKLQPLIDGVLDIVRKVAEEKKAAERPKPKLRISWVEFAD